MNNTGPREANEHKMVVNRQPNQPHSNNNMVPIRGMQAPYPHEVNQHRLSPYSAPDQRRMAMDMPRCMPNPGPMNSANFNGHMMMPPVGNANMHDFNQESMKYIPPQMNRNDLMMNQQMPVARPHDEYAMQQRNNFGFVNAHPERMAMPMRGYPAPYGPSAPRNDMNNHSVYPQFYPNPSRFRHPMDMGMMNLNMNRHPKMMNNFHPPGSRMPPQMGGQHATGTQMNNQDCYGNAHDRVKSIDSQASVPIDMVRSKNGIPTNEFLTRKDSVDSGVLPVPSLNDPKNELDVKNHKDTTDINHPIRTVVTEGQEMFTNKHGTTNQISPCNSSMQDSNAQSEAQNFDHSCSSPSSHVTSVNNTDHNTIDNQRELDAASILCSLYRITPTMEGASLSLFASLDRSPIKEEVSSPLSHEGNNLNNLKKYPTRLAISSDELELNSLHCFIRKELLELFVVNDNQNQDSIVATVSKDDDESHNEDDNDNSSKVTSKCSSNASRGRAGLRCVFCSGRLMRSSNASMRMFYPRKLSDLYKMVSTWQRVHFSKCKFVPQEIRDKYELLKVSDKSRGKKIYWVESAMEIGLSDDEKYGGGLRFVK